MDKTKEMTQEREAAILEGAINKWGNTLQITVAIEELSELQKALCKYLRFSGKTSRGHIPPYFDEPLAPFDDAVIREEIADVSIMLNQLELIFGDCTEEEIAKLERLEKLVGIVPQQTLAHQEPDGTWALNDPPPDFAVSPWTPEDVRVASAIKALYPAAQYAVRVADGQIAACKFLRPSRDGVCEFFSRGLFPALDIGSAVPIDDILAAGGDVE